VADVTDCGVYIPIKFIYIPYEELLQDVVSLQIVLTRRSAGILSYFSNPLCKSL